MSAALCGEDDAYQRHLERAYHARLEAGERLAAARDAFWIAFRLFPLGETGQATGWLGRSEALVNDAGGECVERGYLKLPAVHRLLANGDFAGAAARAAEVVKIGERFHDANLVNFALMLRGRALVRQGNVEAGMGLLDRSMIAAASGEVSAIFTGLIYCSVIDTCQEVFAFDRCREWTSALDAWCGEQPQLVPFTGTCLVHRSEIKQLNGSWDDAIAEARRASDRLSPATDPQATAAAFYQQAEIHRLRGELAVAEEAYRRASEAGGEPQPGLALLRLAQGRGDLAANAIRRATGTAKSKLVRARFLPACVDIALARGEVAEAREAADKLRDVAAEYATDVLMALADRADGAVKLAEGDGPGALGPLRRAFAVWQRIGAPYLAAQVRVSIATAYRALGDHEGADLDLASARSVFAELGAVADLARLDALAAPTPHAAASGLTARELQVLRMVASGKTNKAIAGELTLSEKTVDRHVSNIFNKLDVQTRAAATAYAYKHNLV